VHVSDGSVDGYVAYRIVSEDQEVIAVKELVFSAPEHRRDMLAFLGDKYPEHQIRFDTPIDDFFLHEIADPMAVNVSVQPAFQLRVMDPQGAMLALAADKSISGKLSFRISDPVFEEGHSFGIEVEQGSISACESDPSLALEMDVQTFAKLYSGYLTAGDAWYLGKIKMDETAASALVLACEIFSSLGPYRSWLEPG
jgi:predicted acetyltransferase